MVVELAQTFLVCHLVGSHVGWALLQGRRRPACRRVRPKQNESTKLRSSLVWR